MTPPTTAILYELMNWKERIRSSIRHYVIMFRRMLSLSVVFALIAGALQVPVPPALICRMTGQAMPMVLVAQNFVPEVASCCHVTITNAKGDAPELALVAPGCCDLRQGADISQPISVLASSSDFDQNAVLPVVVELGFLPFVQSSTASTLYGVIPPRAPPRSSSSPRAPPLS